MAGAGATLDVAPGKKDFPILRRDMAGHRLVFLDSAARSQKPPPVLDPREQTESSVAVMVDVPPLIVADSRTLRLLPLRLIEIPGHGECHTLL